MPAIKNCFENARNNILSIFLSLMNINEFSPTFSRTAAQRQCCLSLFVRCEGCWIMLHRQWIIVFARVRRSIANNCKLFQFPVRSLFYASCIVTARRIQFWFYGTFFTDRRLLSWQRSEINIANGFSSSFRADFLIVYTAFNNCVSTNKNWQSESMKNIWSSDYEM